MGADLKNDPTFFDRADGFIRLANEHCVDIGRGKVSASLLYGSARFQAWNAACWADNGEDMKAKREETVKYFVEQYKTMLQENLDDYIEHYGKYMQVGGESNPSLDSNAGVKNHIVPAHLVRTLQPSDSLLEITVLLHRAYARLGAMGLNYTAVDQTPDTTVKRIEGGQCYVVEVEGRLAGTIVVKPTYRENECEYFTRQGVAAVHQFAVDPDFQGRGIGRALLQACEEWARQRGFRELAMDTAEQAEHLIKLYAGLGYNHVDFVQWPGKVYRSVVLSKALE